MSVGRDGRQGWSRESEKAWERVFGKGLRGSLAKEPEPEPKKEAGQ